MIVHPKPPPVRPCHHEWVHGCLCWGERYDYGYFESYEFYTEFALFGDAARSLAKAVTMFGDAIRRVWLSPMFWRWHWCFHYPARNDFFTRDRESRARSPPRDDPRTTSRRQHQREERI